MNRVDDSTPGIEDKNEERREMREYRREKREYGGMVSRESSTR